MAGMFVVKRTPGRFNAVGADMCLEQTINGSQNGIIGSTKKKNFVAQWEIIQHEILAVVNLYREISALQTPSSELVVNHEFTQSATNTSEANVRDIITYMTKRTQPMFHLVQKRSSTIS
jgi:hypothetical protein